MAPRLTGLALTAAIVAATAAGCAGGGRHAEQAIACRHISRSGTAVVPRVTGATLDVALRRLLRRQLLISVPRFIPFHDAMAEQGWGRLQNYRVVAQAPRPGAAASAGSAVRLRLDDPVFRGPIGSMVEPVHHPMYARIPDLVGTRYPQAMAAATERSGILVRVSTTGPLAPAISACGLAAFVVTSQSPRPGTRVLWGGIRDHEGVQPGLATVTIQLAARPVR
jgi:hypothetical protein